VFWPFQGEACQFRLCCVAMKLLMRVVAAYLAGALGGATALLRPPGSGAHLLEPFRGFDQITEPGLEQVMLWAGQDPASIGSMANAVKPMIEKGLKQLETDQNNSVQAIRVAVADIRKCLHPVEPMRASKHGERRLMRCSQSRACAGYKRCHKQRVDKYQTLKKFTEAAVKTRQTECRLYKRLECLVNTTGTVSKESLEKCIANRYSCSHLEVYYPSTPRRARCKIRRGCNPRDPLQWTRRAESAARSAESKARRRYWRLKSRERRAKRRADNALIGTERGARGAAKRRSLRRWRALRKEWLMAWRYRSAAWRSWHSKWHSWQRAWRRSERQARLHFVRLAQAARQARRKADAARDEFRRAKGDDRPSALKALRAAWRSRTETRRAKRAAKRSWKALWQIWNAAWRSWRLSWRRAARRARRFERQSHRKYQRLSSAARHAKRRADRARSEAWRRAKSSYRRRAMRKWRAAQRSWSWAFRRSERARRHWKQAWNSWRAMWRRTQLNQQGHAMHLVKAQRRARDQLVRAQRKMYGARGRARSRAVRKWKQAKRKWVAAQRAKNAAIRSWARGWDSLFVTSQRAEQRALRVEQQTRSRFNHFASVERRAKQRYLHAKRYAQRRRCSTRHWQATWRVWRAAWLRREDARRTWSSARRIWMEARRRTHNARWRRKRAIRSWRRAWKSAHAAPRRSRPDDYVEDDRSQPRHGGYHVRVEAHSRGGRGGGRGRPRR